MEFSISEVAEKMNVTVPTLRYYDNIGLFKNLKKNKAGNRVFTEENVKNMPLENMPKEIQKEFKKCHCY